MNIEKIAVNGHYVWVDKDAEIKEDCYALHLGVLGEIEIVTANGQCKLDKKIIAASPELNLDVPTYVEWLAKEEVGWWDKNDDQDVMNFIKGYQTAEKELSVEILTKYQEGFAKALKLCNGSDFIDEVERNRAIDFAKWISCSYSFGNISGMWCFHENTYKQYTEEELYELYFEQIKTR